MEKRIKKTDRRVLRTKKLLLNSLTELMKTKKLKEISVKQLADYADINRGTFYLHYKDVFDMVDAIEAEILNELSQIFINNVYSSKENPHPKLIFEQIYLLFKENKNTLVALIGPNGDSSLLFRIEAVVSEHLTNIWDMSHFSKDSFDYYRSFIVGGCTGLMQTWIKNDCDIPCHEMADKTCQIIQHGISLFSKE